MISRFRLFGLALLLTVSCAPCVVHCNPSDANACPSGESCELIAGVDCTSTCPDCDGYRCIATDGG